MPKLLKVGQCGIYGNGVEVKHLPNRKTLVIKAENISDYPVDIQLLRVPTPEELAALKKDLMPGTDRLITGQRLLKGKVLVSSFNLSIEGAHALQQALSLYIKHFYK